MKQLRSGDIDLLPTSLRQRVMRARASMRATRTALGLVLIGAMAAAGAEAVRTDAFNRDEDARVAASGTLAAREARVRLQAMIDARTENLHHSMADVNRVPLAALLAALAEPLPDSAHLASAQFSEEEQSLVVEASVSGADASLIVESIRKRAPSFTITAIDAETLRIVVPRDRPFVLTAHAEDKADAR